MQVAQSQIGDRELERRVASTLYERCHPLRSITAKSKDGTVTLRGTVNSFYERQLCIELSRRIDGVIKLIDEIDVAERNGRP